MVREVTPRDTTAESQLLEIAARAFNPAYAAGGPIKRLVAPVFKEMTAKYGRYLLGGGFEPTWAHVAEITEKETMLSYSLDAQMPKLAAAAPQLQLTTEQQAAKAAANKEASAARAAARKGEAPLAMGEFVPYPIWDKLSSAEKKARTEARAKLEEKESSGN